ncbi:MAG: hypothetical protein FWD92_03150 [Methanomassiliicoccaceae archaeon]|nr:hypothetical protein [Methanomassiliicoccaceae archaeon]
MGKGAENSDGLLSFLGGNRKVGVNAGEKKESVFSNIGSAIRYTLLLSMLFWWLPIIGQAIAGYVGGRVGGSPAKGMVATLMSVMIVMGAIAILSSGIIRGFGFLLADPEQTAASIGEMSAVLGSLLTTLLTFLQGFFDTMGLTTSMMINIYIITVVFGMVGGVISSQRSKEAKRSAPVERVFMPRSLAAYVHGKKLGFEDFDDRLSIQRSKVPERRVVVCNSLVRSSVAREEPKAISAGSVPVAAQEAEQRESPFTGLIHRAEKNDPEKERTRHSLTREDMEYV